VRSEELLNGKRPSWEADVLCGGGDSYKENNKVAMYCFLKPPLADRIESRFQFENINKEG